jgi:isopenicillin N synthase-like dioxygenase
MQEKDEADIALVDVDDASGIWAQLTRRSFAVVRLRDDSVHSHLARVATVLDGFASDSYDEALEFGRLKLPHKEFMAVKTGLPLASLWPNKEAKRFCEQLFDLQDQLARRIFLSLGVSGGRELLQEHPMEIGQISSSFMHLFRYTGAASEHGDPCAPHTDSGLITIIPRALGAPGLECHDGQRFVNTEQLFPEASKVCTILAGETMAALTRGKVRGTVHRVVATHGERFSIPFQLKASDLSDKMRELMVV